MSKTTKTVIAVALSFYVAAIAAYKIGEMIYPDPFFGTEDIWQWTAWDYSALSLLVVALGFTIAAVRMWADEQYTLKTLPRRTRN